MIFRFIFIALAISVTGCVNTTKSTFNNLNTQKADSVFVPKYAKGFMVEYYDGYKLLKIKNPFDSLSADKIICIQTDSSCPINDVKSGSHIYLSNHNWIALSSTQISSANLLSVKDLIIGVAEPKYISDNYIHQQLEKGNIRNIGMAMSPDLEIIQACNPAFIMVSPFPDISYKRIEEAGIAVVPNGSYMESTPLGRAEWLIFSGQLFNLEHKAKKIFNQIEQRYNHLKLFADSLHDMPTLFTGHLYQGIWNTPQKDNYMACFFKDAKTNYIFNDEPGSGTLMLEFETVYDKAFQTDYWLIIVNSQEKFSYQNLLDMDSRYADFKAYKDKRIIYTNVNKSKFFESAEQEPDVVLADIINATHPNTLDHYKPVYFFTLLK